MEIVEKRCIADREDRSEWRKELGKIMYKGRLGWKKEGKEVQGDSRSSGRREKKQNEHYTR